MDVGSSFIADDETLHLIQPGEGALHHPAVPAQPLTGVDPRACDSALDAACSQDCLVPARTVALVGVQFRRPAARPAYPAPHRGDGVEQYLQKPRLVAVCRRDQRTERDAVGVDHKMALRARFAAIRWIRAGLGSPFFAGTEEASAEARDQSSWSASRNRLSSSCWSFVHTPAACQSRKRRQQVMPEPQPISCGSISQGMPLRSTKMIPPKQARSGFRGAPPWGFGRSGGSSGWMTAQSSSGTSGVAIPGYPAKIRFC